jgi:hypothetical protein
MDKMQLDELMEMLDQVSGAISKIREMVPGDAAAEQSDEIDSATAGEGEVSEDPAPLKPAGDKEVRKAAMVSMLKKQAL